MPKSPLTSRPLPASYLEIFEDTSVSIVPSVPDVGMAKLDVIPLVRMGSISRHNVEWKKPNFRWRTRLFTATTISKENSLQNNIIMPFLWAHICAHRISRQRVLEHTQEPAEWVPLERGEKGPELRLVLRDLTFIFNVFVFCEN